MPNLAKPTQAWNLPWDADWVTAVAWLGPSRRVAAGNNLGQILLWELPDKPGGDAPRPVAGLVGHTNVVSHLAATPDGKTLLSASYDHTVRYWSIPDKLPEPSEAVPLNARAIEELKRRRSSKLPAPLEAKVGVLKPARTLAEHREWVVAMGLSRDGDAIITGDDGGHVIVWDVALGAAVKPGSAGDRSRVPAEAAVKPGSAGDRPRVPTAEVKKRWKLPKGWVYAAALSPDAKQACVTERLPLVFDSGRHAAVRLSDVASGTVTKDLSAAKEFKGHHMAAAAYSPDGKTLAVIRGGESNGPSGKPVLVDPASGKVLKELAPGHLDGGTALAWHPDGKHLASAGRDTLVRIWDVAAGKPVAEVGKGRGGQFKDWICDLSWSADGDWLAAADQAGAVQVWTFN
jgi:WD40 repeat protein